MATGPRFERWLLVAAVLGWVIAAAVNLVTGPSLGYDEAAFAALARGDDTPVWLYRSSGVVALARVGVALGGDEWQLRLPFVVLGTGVPLAAFALGRAAFDARTGAWAAAVLATAHPMLVRTAQVLGDLLAVGGVLAGLALVIGELGRADGPRRRLLLAAPAFAFAFYMRYGSAPVIALAAVLAIVVWHRAVRRAPGLVLATAGLGALLLVPHVAHSLAETGSALGVLRVAAITPHRAYLGEGLVTYVTANPFLYYGFVAAPCALIGIAGVALRRRAAVYLVAVGLGQLVLIGVQSHAQPRYVFVAIALLVVVGVHAIRSWAPRRFPRLMLGVLAVAWLVAVRWVVRTNASLATTRAPIVAAAGAIRAHGASPCIVLASSVPQILWYSGCRTGRFYYLLEPGALAPHRRRYLFELGQPLDPQWHVDHPVTLHALATGAGTRLWAIE